MIVRKLWGNQIAGPVAAIFAVVLPVVALRLDATRTTAIWLGVAPLLLAVLLIWPAQYQAWKRELEERNTETNRNQKPELKGEAYDFSRDPNGTITRTVSNVDGHRVYVPFNFTLAITNHRQVTTNVSRLIIDATEVEPPIELWEVSYAHSIELEYAKIVRLLVTGKAIVKVDPDEIGIVRLDRLKVAVVDGLGISHEIPVHPNSQWPLRSY
jgi:hypothetical protein